MRILHINKYAFPKGGAEYYMLRLSSRQAEAGHRVAVLGSQPQANVFHPDIQAYDFAAPDFHNVRLYERPQVAVRTVWSRPSASKVEQILDEFRPDVVHLHNYAHQLTSSIIPVLRRAAVRSVYTAHDYKLVCPAYVATRAGDDCFECRSRISRRLLMERCHHGSLPWSAVVAAEGAVVRRGKLLPDHIIAPSEFMRNALEGSWIQGVPIDLIRNPAPKLDALWQGGGGYLLYVGRLSREKGVASLIEAANSAGFPLVVAGDGPLRSDLETLAGTLGADVTFVGHVDDNRIRELRSLCTAQVLSSEWPENAPLSALEAAAQAVPLLLTRRGGLPELRDIGARAAVIDAVQAAALLRGVDELRGLQWDPRRFAAETSWSAHLAKVESVYDGMKSCA